VGVDELFASPVIEAPLKRSAAHQIFEGLLKSGQRQALRMLDKHGNDALE